MKDVLKLRQLNDYNKHKYYFCLKTCLAVVLGIACSYTPTLLAGHSETEAEAQVEVAEGGDVPAPTEQAHDAVLAERRAGLKGIEFFAHLSKKPLGFIASEG